MGGGVIQSEPDRWAAENTPTGIFVANGPDIRQEGNLGEIEIVDIAPTILASHDVAVPTDIDGEVLDIFVEDLSPGTQNPIEEYERSKGDGSEEVADRLKQLGYME
jgi:hypothetical protein